jgi:hypothetical protein
VRALASEGLGGAIWCPSRLCIHWSVFVVYVSPEPGLSELAGPSSSSGC